MIRKYKAFIIKRIHLSKPSIKHTSTKAIITLFSFNITKNYFFYEKFTKLNKYTNKRILKRSKELLKKKIEKIRVLLYRQGKISKSQAKKQLIKAYTAREQEISDKKAILFLKKVKGAALAKQPLRLLNPGQHTSCVASEGWGSGKVSQDEASFATQKLKVNDRAAVVDAIQSNSNGLLISSRQAMPAILRKEGALLGKKKAEYPNIMSITPELRSKQQQKKELILFKYKLLNQLVKYLNFYLKIYFYLIKMRKYENIKRLYYNKLTLKYRRCQYRYYIYKYKFEKTKFLPILTKLLKKFINKKIEYNIINLKSIVYSPEIFTKAISLKLRKKKIRLHKYMGYVLGNVRISKDYNVILRKNFFKVNKDQYMNKNSFVNKYKNLLLINLFQKDKGFLKNIRSNKMKARASQLNNERLLALVFNKIKYKKLGGIKLRVKGRLTKRYRADRAVTRQRITGSLMDINSSLKRQSGVVYRGNQPSHILSAFSGGVRRIGAYGVTGWIAAKNYSTSRFVARNYTTIVPVVKYSNADHDKIQIIKENKKKSGVYRWINNLNGNSYVGSSVDLTKRLRLYYKNNSLKKNNMAINKSILKYGHSNFSLEILEYCDKSKVLSREQYYLDNLKPKYNILKHAGSWLGVKHSRATLAKLKLIWANNAELRAKRLEPLILYRNSEAHKINFKKLLSSPEHKEHLKKLHSKSSIKINVWDILKRENTSYPSSRVAGSLLGIDKSTILRALRYIKEKGIPKLINKRYLIFPLDKVLLPSDYLSAAKVAAEIALKNQKLKPNSQKIEVLDLLTNEKTCYPSMSDAAEATGVSLSGIVSAFKRKKEKGIDVVTLKKRYQMTKIN